MVDLVQELYAQVAALIAEESSLDELRIWLASNAPELAETTNAPARVLSNRAWTLLAEYDRGHRTELDVRTALAEILSSSEQLSIHRG